MALYEDEKVKVRDYILNQYGGKYGIVDKDIGWDQQTGTVLLKGDPLLKPVELINDRSYAGQSTVDTALATFIKQRGMQPTQSPSNFTGSYSDKIDSMIEGLLEQESFSYNFESDPVYQALAAQNEKLGNTAMSNTMSEASALTGGRLNSWATSAGMQAKQSYDQNTLAAIPQLEANAYSRYSNQAAEKMALIQMMMQQDQGDYEKYMDNLGFTQQQLENEFANKNFGENVRQFDEGMAFDREKFDYTKEQNIFENDLAKQQLSASQSAARQSYSTKSSAPKTTTEPKDEPLLDLNTALIRATAMLPEGTPSGAIKVLAEELMAGQGSTYDAGMASIMADMFEAKDVYGYLTSKKKMIIDTLGKEAYDKLFAAIPASLKRYYENF